MSRHALGSAELRLARPNLVRLGDLLFQLVCMAAALAVPVLAALLVVSLLHMSWPALRQLGVRFFVDANWDPQTLDFGALPFIYGTLATSAIAMLIAVPLSVGAAAFLAEIASGWLRRAGSFLIELLAAIPSVVYGFWGIFFLAPLVQKLFDALGGPNRGGTGIFSAGVILAIMIVPYIAAITYDVCQAVPRSQREGSLALGSTRWQMIWSVVLPYARSGIVGACFLALGRAVGETMAVAMLIGNRPVIDLSLFAVGASIPSVIANELATAATDLQTSALVELGLVLFVVTVLVNCLARILIWRVGRQHSRRLSLFRRPSGVAGQSVDKEELAVGRVRPSIPLKDQLSAGRQKFTREFDQIMTVVLGVCLLISLIPLFHILGYITYRGLDSVNVAFFTHLPNDDPPGLGHALLGSGLLVGLATVCAVPLGVLAAIYLAEYRRSRLAPVARFVGELLGGVPSIVIGIFAYAVLVRPMDDFSGWAGAFALGVMMIPIVMRASEEALKLVPTSLRNASYALGATHWQTVVRVIVPAALPAIITAIFLAIARIAGETAPLLFTCYNTQYWPHSPNSRVPFLTYYIYNYSRSDVPEQQRQAWAGALVLLALIIILNVGIRLVTGRRQVSASRAD